MQNRSEPSGEFVRPLGVPPTTSLVVLSNRTGEHRRFRDVGSTPPVSRKPFAIERSRGTEDKRRHSLQLTKTGERMLDRLAEPARRAQARVL